MITIDLIARIKEFLENEARSCSMENLRFMVKGYD